MARRRMLSTRISLSRKINHVSDQAALLYTWMIPHLDELGLMEADPEIVKAQVVPLRDTFSDEVVEVIRLVRQAIGDYHNTYGKEE